MPRNESIYAENPREIIAHCETRSIAGEEVATDCARAIAGQWHDGQGSAFYAFASSGHYDRAALLVELSDTIASDYRGADEDSKLMLDMLGTYLVNRNA